MLLLGTVNIKMDSKNRFRMPGLFRSFFNKSVVVSVGMEGSYEIWDTDEYKKAHQWIIDKPSHSIEWRQYKRLLMANAFELSINDVGRVLLPKIIASKLNSRDLVLIGSGNHLELWSKENWNEYNNKLLKNKERIAQEIGNAKD